MSSQAEAHGLGPHVVGQRVVVRRVLRGQTGPSGGPAMTDLLGVCTAWGEGVCVVAPSSGPPVTIALADIVSGKPVPPRPSVRHRVSPHEAELHVQSLWPELETRPLGGWLLRAAPPYEGRLRRRANSVLAMDEPGIPLAEADREIRAFYAERDRPALAQVEAGSRPEADLHAAGWRPLPDGEAEFMIASVAQVLRRAGRNRAIAADVQVLSAETFHSAAIAPDGQPTDSVGAEASIGDRARGRAALDGDWVGLHSLDVDPRHRRQGLGTAVVADLLDWAASQGATTAWLHVETDNPGARELYERLGFRTHHTMRYLRATT
ncbi:MAG: GNAT family N-acetyltransferase [Nocardioides sp.]